MPQPRKLVVSVEWVRRLLRVGATANLLNLLQKQHPADLAQLLSALQDRERHAAFAILIERNGRLAMEALSELGPETGASLLADRSADERHRVARGADRHRVQPHPRSSRLPLEAAVVVAATLRQHDGRP